MTPQCVSSKICKGGGYETGFKGEGQNWLKGRKTNGSRRGRHWFLGGGAKLVKGGQNWLKGDGE